MEPIRCVTCNAILHFKMYEDISVNKSSKESLKEMGVKRFCCRRMYISHPVELEELIRTFPLKNFAHDSYAMSFESEVERRVPTI